MENRNNHIPTPEKHAYVTVHRNWESIVISTMNATIYKIYARSNIRLILLR